MKFTSTRGGEQTPHKVLLVNLDEAFRHGLARILLTDPSLEICAAVGPAAKAIAETSRLKPDIVLLDMPIRGGLGTIKRIKDARPEVKILVVSMNEQAQYANRVLRLGSDGYIVKHEDPVEIVAALHDVLAGHIYLSEAVLAGQNDKPPKTKRARSTRKI